MLVRRSLLGHLRGDHHVEYTLKVTDTETGVMRTYSNPLGSRADAVTDTDAFATCP